jgi:hypothetical protein
MNLKVLYLGLSAAYGVSAEGQIAIVGTPTAEGWVFEEKPELFTSIAKPSPPPSVIAIHLSPHFPSASHEIICIPSNITFIASAATARTERS